MWRVTGLQALDRASNSSPLDTIGAEIITNIILGALLAQEWEASMLLQGARDSRNLRPDK